MSHDYVVIQADDAVPPAFHQALVTIGRIELMATKNQNEALLYIGAEFAHFVKLFARANKATQILERRKSNVFADLSLEVYEALTTENGKAPTKDRTEKEVRSHPDYLAVCDQLIQAETGRDICQKQLRSLEITLEAIQTYSANNRTHQRLDAAGNLHAAKTE